MTPSRLGINPWLLSTLLLLAACSGDTKKASDARTLDLPISGDKIRQDSGPAAQGRAITFVNECTFDVWVQAVGSSASDFPCDPKNNTCLGAGGPKGQAVCSTSTRKCECNDDSQCPQKQTCSGGHCACTQDTDCCSSPTDCGVSQRCDTTHPTWKQCYWTIATPVASGAKAPSWHLTPKGTAQSTATSLIPLRGAAGDNTIVWSGAIFPRTGCDAVGLHCASGDCVACQPWMGTSHPHTRVEMTLQNRGDFYNLSLIHGVNVPMMIKPVKPADAAWDSAVGAGADFRCGTIGGDKYTSDAVSGATGWGTLGCDYELAGTSEVKPAGWPEHYQLVKGGGATCQKNADCGAEACGRSFEKVDAGSADLTCGALAGWWSADQICAVGVKDISSTFGVPGVVECAKSGLAAPVNWPVANHRLADLLACAPLGVTANALTDSCYQKGATADQCCGCQDWTVSGTKLPVANKADNPPDGGCRASNASWQALVLPALKVLKRACPHAYTYPFDDVSSTWQCSTTGQNRVGYTFTFCPGGREAGVKPPKPSSCSCASWTFATQSPNGVQVFKHSDSQKPILEAAPPTGSDGVAVDLPASSLSSAEEPYRIAVTVAGTPPKIVSSCHVVRDPTTTCLLPTELAGDDCKLFTFQPGFCTVAAMKVAP